MIIAVAGATGVVGSRVVDVAQARGHAVISLARSVGIDLTTGDGLDQALSCAEQSAGSATTSRCRSWASTSCRSATTPERSSRSG